MISFIFFATIKLFSFQATSETAPGTVMLISAGITAIPICMSTWMHLHLKGERIAEYPPEEDEEEEAAKEIEEQSSDSQTESSQTESPKNCESADLEKSQFQ